MAGYSRGVDAARVGAIALAAGSAFMGLFGYATNRTLSAEHSDLHVRFQSADGLRKGDAVQFLGVTVGEVKALRFDGNGTVVVQLRLTEPVPLDERAAAELVAVDIFGRQSVVLHAGAGNRRLVSGDTIEGTAAASMTGKVEALSEKAGRFLGDTTLTLVHGTLGGVSDAVRTIATVATETGALLGAQSEDLSNALRGVTAVAANLHSATDPAEVAAIRADIEATTSSIRTMTTRMDSVAMLLGAILTRVESSEGTISKLLEDPSLYDRVVGSLASLELLLIDLRENPKRYINLSIF